MGGAEPAGRLLDRLQPCDKSTFVTASASGFGGSGGGAHGAPVILQLNNTVAGIHWLTSVCMSV